MRDDVMTETMSYAVLVNDEKQYSIFPAELDAPLGWHKTGKQGTKQECIAHIDEVWTDMRPLSLQLEMDKSTE